MTWETEEYMGDEIAEPVAAQSPKNGALEGRGAHGLGHSRAGKRLGDGDKQWPLFKSLWGFMMKMLA